MEGGFPPDLRLQVRAPNHTFLKENDMARTELTVQTIDRDGLVVAQTAGDAANDHSFENLNEDVFLEVDNQGSGAVQVTVDVPLSVDGLAVPDLVISVAAGDRVMIKKFAKSVYNQEDAGNSIDKAVLIDLDQDSNVYLAAIKVT